MQKKIEKHRLSAFVNGLLSGLGFILITWGLVSIVAVPSSGATIYISLILFGVFMFVGGGFREAYIWGSFSSRPSNQKNRLTAQVQPAPSSKQTERHKKEEKQAASQVQTDSHRVTTEQIREYPLGTQTIENVAYDQEKQT